VAPLRFGAGVHGGVLASLAAGVPCVMSPVSAEGLNLSPPLAACIGANAPQMAQFMVRLYTQERDYDAVSQAASSFIAAGFSEDVVRDQIKAAIEGRRVPETAQAPLAHLAGSRDAI
jgi:hypothetical protein